MRGFVLLAAIAGLLFITPTDARSSDPVTTALNVAVFDVVPWAKLDDEGQVRGVTSDFFNAITERTGISFNLMVVPYKRMVHMLEHGDADASIFFRSPVSEKISDQLAVVHIVDTIVIGLKGMNIRTYDDLAELTMVSPRGISLGERYDQDQSLKKLLSSNYQQSVKMLLNDRVDAVAGPVTSLYYSFSRAGKSKSDLGSALKIGQKQAWLQVSRNFKNPAIRQKLTTAVDALRAEGVFKRIMDHHFFDPRSPT